MPRRRPAADAGGAALAGGGGARCGICARAQHGGGGGTPQPCRRYQARILRTRGERVPRGLCFAATVYALALAAVALWGLVDVRTAHDPLFVRPHRLSRAAEDAQWLAPDPAAGAARGPGNHGVVSTGPRPRAGAYSAAAVSISAVAAQLFSGTQWNWYRLGDLLKLEDATVLRDVLDGFPGSIGAEYAQEQLDLHAVNGYYTPYAYAMLRRIVERRLRGTSQNDPLEPPLHAGDHQGGLLVLHLRVGDVLCTDIAGDPMIRLREEPKPPLPSQQRWGWGRSSSSVSAALGVDMPLLDVEQQQRRRAAGVAAAGTDLPASRSAARDERVGHDDAADHQVSGRVGALMQVVNDVIDGTIDGLRAVLLRARAFLAGGAINTMPKQHSHAAATSGRAAPMPVGSSFQLGTDAGDSPSRVHAEDVFGRSGAALEEERRRKERTYAKLGNREFFEGVARHARAHNLTSAVLLAGTHHDACLRRSARYVINREQVRMCQR